jgi:hypothetical protein
VSDSVQRLEVWRWSFSILEKSVKQVTSLNLENYSCIPAASIQSLYPFIFPLISSTVFSLIWSSLMTLEASPPMALAFHESTYLSLYFFSNIAIFCVSYTQL